MEMRYGGVECRGHWACCAVGWNSVLVTRIAPEKGEGRVR